VRRWRVVPREVENRALGGPIRRNSSGFGTGALGWLAAVPGEQLTFPISCWTGLEGLTGWNQFGRNAEA